MKILEMIVIVPSAGDSTRMSPLNVKRTKHLIPILGRAVICHIIERVLELSPSKVIIVASFRNVSHILNIVNKYDDNISIVIQEQCRGIADAIYTAVKHVDVDEPVLVYLGDNIFSRSLRGLVYDDSRLQIVTAWTEEAYRYGIIITSGGTFHIVEKPRNIKRGLALTGLAVFPSVKIIKRAFRRLRPSERGEYEYSDLIRKVAEIVGSMEIVEISEREWASIDYPRDLLKTIDILLRGDSYLHPTSEVCEEATLETADIEANTIVIGRGRITRSLILENCEIELENGEIINTVIGEESKIRVRNSKIVNTIIPPRTELIVEA